jgi:hypothetical protein
MAVSYQIFKKKRLVIITASGQSDLKEIMSTLQQMFDDPEYSLEYDLLWDATKITTVFSSDDIRELVQYFKRYKGEKPPKRAIVISPSLPYGVTRVFESMASISSRAQIGLFSDIAEAFKWLKH